MRFLDPAIMADLYGPAHLWFLEYLIPMLAAFGFWRKSRLDREAVRAKIRADLASRERKIQTGRGARRKKVRADQPSRSPGRSAGLEEAGNSMAPGSLGPDRAGFAGGPALLLVSRVVSGVDAALDRHNSFFPGPIRLVYYGVFFAFGVGLHRVRGGMDLLAGRRWWFLVGSVMAFAVRASLLRLDWSSPLEGSMALALAASGALASWLSLFALLGFYRKHFNRPSPTFRTLAEASFWIYLAHLPVVGLIQMDLLHAPIPTVAKFAITLGLTLALGLASYAVLIRKTRFGRFLNGGKTNLVST